eukprot:496554-Rhodomonas_salina.1
MLKIAGSKHPSHKLRSLNTSMIFLSLLPEALAPSPLNPRPKEGVQRGAASGGLTEGRERRTKREERGEFEALRLTEGGRLDPGGSGSGSGSGCSVQPKPA